MKAKKLLGIIFVFGIFLFAGFVGASDSDEMLVKVNVLETEVSISVPEEVVFGDIAQGYLSERQEIEINNLGTVDVDVSMDLDESYTGSIFQNIAFRKVLADPLIYIRYFNFEILKPEMVGGERGEEVYMYLDLTEYEEEITTTMIDHEATVVFTAVPL